MLREVKRSKQQTKNNYLRKLAGDVTKVSTSGKVATVPWKIIWEKLKFATSQPGYA